MASHLRVFTALCLLSAFLCMVGFAIAVPNLVVEGRVYCDTCRAGFETKATEYIEGAKVKLECKNYTTGASTFTAEGVTNTMGTYQISVSDDHQEESCAVMLVSSPRSDCSEISDGRNLAPVVLTHNVGITTGVRYANSLGFLKDEPLASCGQMLMQYALGVDD
ncbi:Pollen-specific protein [Musa troglodytarum]|uniref:Pollen-specific protein n=1 Tax=Musa troglodytarum TaxID=320322 RepID=A0A9E7GPM1_9LILI|nr:Pollen-specific protein [Musa troglodytarum]